MLGAEAMNRRSEGCFFLPSAKGERGKHAEEWMCRDRWKDRRTTFLVVYICSYLCR